jgi:cytochrome P450
LSWLRDPAGHHHALRARHGDPFLTYLGQLKLVVTGSPKGVRDIFTAPIDAFTPTGVGLAEMMGEHAIPVLEGEQHLTMRRRLNAVLLDRQDAGVAPAILDIARRHVGAWPRRRSMAAEPLLRRISFDVILRIVFGVVDPGRAAAYADAFEELGRQSSVSLVLFPALRRGLGRWSPWARFRAAQRRVHTLILEDIAAARARGGPEPGGFDTLGHLVALRGDDGEPAMSDEAIRDTLTTLLFAGYESTAAAMAWSLYWSWTTPGVLDRLRTELAQAWSCPDHAAEMAAAALRLPWLEAICREGLRLSPVAPLVVRQVARPLRVAGHTLPAGVLVGASVDLAHANPGVFPEPAAFRPERFLHGRFHPTELLPFGGGRRHCPGARLALDEMRLVLAVLASTPGLAVMDRRPPRRVLRGPMLAPARGAPTIRIEEQQA